jgi:eukaryotic-like serine/threonine-protein kinase
MSEVRFGPYRVLETLGSGALSTIYKAVQEPLGRVVALKSLKTQIAPTSSFAEQIERESKILVDLLHPNIVLLLDHARSAAGRPYLVLEHVDGPPLSKVLAKRKKLSPQAALAIACQMCAALEHAHQRGIVHRDVKPSNVLLAKSGVVKMIDFGIAQRPRTVSVSDAEGITPSGRFAPEPLKDAFGTPAYMSPEQILGDFVDGRSDLFSVGVVLYQMLTGSRPFEAPGQGDENARQSQRPPLSVQRSRRDTPPALRERAPEVPRTVERIVMRLLEKAPQERYPDAKTVRARLETALGAITRDEPVALVRAALAEAGFIPQDKKAAPQPAASRVARFGTVRAALAGQALVLCLFGLGVLAIEGASSEARAARDAARAGSQPLALTPPDAGGLKVVATPWAFVKVDGQDVETTPFARPIPLSAGKHFVTLSHPDGPPVEREVTIAPGEIVTLDVTMPSVAQDAGKDAQ